MAIHIYSRDVYTYYDRVTKVSIIRTSLSRICRETGLPHRVVEKVLRIERKRFYEDDRGLVIRTSSGDIETGKQGRGFANQ